MKEKIKYNNNFEKINLQLESNSETYFKNLFIKHKHIKFFDKLKKYITKNSKQINNMNEYVNTIEEASKQINDIYIEIGNNIHNVGLISYTNALFNLFWNKFIIKGETKLSVILEEKYNKYKNKRKSLCNFYDVDVLETIPIIINIENSKLFCILSPHIIYINDQTAKEIDYNDLSKMILSIDLDKSLSLSYNVYNLEYFKNWVIDENVFTINHNVKYMLCYNPTNNIKDINNMYKKCKGAYLPINTSYLNNTNYVESNMRMQKNLIYVVMNFYINMTEINIM